MLEQRHPKRERVKETWNNYLQQDVTFPSQRPRKRNLEISFDHYIGKQDHICFSVF